MSDVVIGEKEREELAQFISGLRKQPELGFWFIGRYVAEGENELVCESLRGDIDEKTGQWHPFVSERRACCDAIKATDEEPFALMYHCADAEHVRNLIAELSDEEAKREYDYMLENVYESLMGDWNV